MTPRRWDVGRTVAVGAAVTAMMLVAASCGQERFAAPPEPEFVSGTRAEPTLPAPPAPRSEGSEILPVDVESDVGDEASGDVGQMVIVDDAGQVAPNRSGWAVVDDVLARRLIPADVSASVAVMVDGQVVHRAAYGERVAGSGDPAETTDRFRIASISKTITAIVALQLVEDGVLALDEPVGPLLVEHLGLDAFDPDVTSTTVRELLGHRAGFPQHEGTFFSGGASSCVDAATRGLGSGVSSGSGFRYSNMSYCVLGVLIEAVTGKTYERVVYERLLTPLGISGMRMSSTYDLGPDEVSHHPTPGRNYMETLGAAGAWNATPTDLVTILDSIDPTTSGWKAVSPEMMAELRSPFGPTAPGRAPGGYGLGVINYDDGSFGHTGTIENTHAMVLVEPDGLTWALTVSGDYPSSTPQLRSIMRAALAAGFPAG